MKINSHNYLLKEINKIEKVISKIKIKKLKNFDKLSLLSIKAINKGNKIIIFGNGGSASDAQHLATEFTVRYKKNRKALPAISQATDTSALTAIGNDFGFKHIFSRQIEAIGNKGDIALAITTYGNSLNLIDAVKLANRKKIKTFCFSGNQGGKIKKYVNYPIIIPSKETSVIQVIEIMIGQIFCETLENYFSK